MDIEPRFRPDRVQKLMERRGWKPGQLEVQSGVAYDTIYKLLNTDRPRPSAEIVLRLANALKCSVEYLMGVSNDPKPDGLSVEGALLDLLDAAEDLPEARRRDLLLIAQAYRATSTPTEDDIALIFDTVERVAGREAAEKIALLLWGFLPPRADDSSEGE